MRLIRSALLIKKRDSEAEYDPNIVMIELVLWNCMFYEINYVYAVVTQNNLIYSKRQFSFSSLPWPYIYLQATVDRSMPKTINK